MLRSPTILAISQQRLIPRAIIAVMIKRKSTLDQTQKAKRNKQVEVFSILDICLQVPADDRLILRNRIREGDDALANRILQCKRDKNFHSLQICLRKYLQREKKNNNFGLIVRDASSRRGKTPQTFKSRGAATESSFPNSLQNSLQSSPSAKKAPAKAQITLSKFDLERNVENQIDQEIWEGIRSEECEEQCRGITPREEENSSIFMSRMSPRKTSPSAQGPHQEKRRETTELGIKDLVKQKLMRQKMKKKVNSTPDYNLQNKKRLTLERQKREQKQNVLDGSPVAGLKSSFFYQSVLREQLAMGRGNWAMGGGNSAMGSGNSAMGRERQSNEMGDPTGVFVRQKANMNPKYGQFYKRIRKAIESDE